MLKETAIKRAKEELDIDIKIIDDEPFLMYVPKPGNPKIDVLLVHFLATRDGEPKIQNDTKKYDWFDIENLPSNVGPNITPALRHFGFLK